MEEYVRANRGPYAQLKTKLDQTYEISKSFSGEGKWMTRQKPQYTFQARLSVPITLGVELPLVYRYANRTDQINQSASEARLGLAFDLMRLAAVLK